MIETTELAKLKAIIEATELFFIIAHPSPDPDAIGSCLAMCNLMQKYNKEIICCIFDRPDWDYKAFDSDNNLQLYSEELLKTFIDSNKKKAFVVLDVGDVKRTPISKIILESNIPIINIDHHETEVDYQLAATNVNIISQTRSTTEIIYKIYNYLNIEINADTATSVLLGLFGDSEGFQDINMTAELFTIVSELINRGGVMDKIVTKLIRSKSAKNFKAISALQQLVELKDNFAYIIVDNDKFNEIQATYSYTIKKHDLLDEIRKLEDIDFAFVLLQHEPNKLTCSFKTRIPGVNVEPLAAHFGGGGHSISSAFRYEFTGSFKDEVEKILTFVTENSRSS